MSSTADTVPSFPTSEPTPEYTPPPGDLPKQFPEKQPLSDDGVDAAKREASSRMISPDHSGEDREVESGIDREDPEETRSADGDEAMK